MPNRLSYIEPMLKIIMHLEYEGNTNNNAKLPIDAPFVRYDPMSMPY